MMEGSSGSLPQKPAEVGGGSLKEESKKLAQDFSKDARFTQFAEGILRIPEDQSFESTLKAHVDQLDPESLQNSPEQLKSLQRFLSLFPATSSSVLFGQQSLHPLLAQSVVFTFQEQAFNKFDTAQAVAALEYQIEQVDSNLKPLIFEFIEKGTAEAKPEQIPGLLKIANQLNMPGLLALLKKRLVNEKQLKNLDSKQLFECLKIAVESQMNNLCWGIIQEMKKKETEPDPAQQTLFKLGKIVTLNPANRISVRIEKQDDLNSLKEALAAGVFINEIMISSLKERLDFDGLDLDKVLKLSIY